MFAYFTVVLDLSGLQKGNKLYIDVHFFLFIYVTFVVLLHSPDGPTEGCTDCQMHIVVMQIVFFLLEKRYRVIVNEEKVRHNVVEKSNKEKYYWQCL